MKHIMISIKPEYVCKILNKEKLLEIRKSIPKCVLDGEECIADIYCTKDPKHLVAPFRFVEGWSYKVYDDKTSYSNGCTSNMRETINGKVVARFRLKRFDSFGEKDGETRKPVNIKVLYQSCITWDELDNYIGNKTGYAWHIEDLHIYDKPKELAEFGLKRPPQSWCYIEGENNESLCD